MLKRGLLVVAFLLCAVPAFATRTFYVSTSGSDSNDGLTHGTAWRWAPGFIEATGVPAALTPAGDDTYIFKGGETWLGILQPSFNGTSGHPIIYSSGDHSWFAGGSWVKPIWSVNYVASYVTKFSANHYFAIDGIEMSYIMAATPDEGGIIELYTSHHIAMSNLYIHGWQMPGSGPRTDGAHGGIVVYSYDDVAADAPTVTLTDSVIENSENTGSNTQTGLAARFIGVMTRVTIHDVHCAVLFTIDWNYGYQYNIGYPGGNVSPGAEPFHGNGVYMDPSTLGQSTGYIRNSRFRDVSSNSQMAYPNIRAGATAYVYNNIFSGNISSQGPIHVDPYNYCTGSMHVLPCEGPGNAVILNNVAYIYATEEDTNEMIRIGDRSGASTGPQLVGNLTANNNQVIGPSGTVLLSRPDLISGTYTHLTNLIQTSAQATMQGYDEAHLWAPQNGSGDTVDTGTDESGTFTNTIDGTTRTGTFDIGPHEWVPAVNPSGANRERMHGH